MTDNKYSKVRVNGTDIVGTRATRNGTPFQYLETAAGPNTRITAVYFEETGEVRYFNQAQLEDVTDD